MRATQEFTQDVMQVCRKGHVITDLLHSYPERGRTHCDRCGTATLERCPTCGVELAGAIAVPGLEPVGVRRPPLYCASCGAAFPWTERPRKLTPQPVIALEALLRRVPLVILLASRVRHDNRPPFQVQDEKDLEDLLRALLPLHFDDIRPHCRTPHYAPNTRMDFLLAPERIAVTAKFARPDLRERQLAEQIREDAEYFGSQDNCSVLVSFLYDPEGLLRDPAVLLGERSQADADLEVRCVIGAP